MNSITKKSNKIKVGIGFITGRSNFKNLIRTYVENWGEHGHRNNDNIELHAIVAYDLKYTGASENDFTQVEDDISDLIKSINFISKSDCHEVINSLNKLGIITLEEGNLVFGEGYGKMRNLILYWAIKNNIDYLLFLDDDEYPVAPFKILKDKLSWIGQDVLGTHLKHIANADITRGYHCGYILPIPYMEFDSTLQEQDFKEFIEAISNEQFTWHSIKRNLAEGKGVTYGDMRMLLNPAPKEIKKEGGAKWVVGCNVCINLTNPENIPPYYNPPGARGEDTFFSTCLSNLKVMRIPAYTFHDGFLRYSQMLSGVLPHSLKPVLADEDTIKMRFIKACLGWIRYKPLLMFITRRESYNEEIALMKERLGNTVPVLNNLFNTNKFNQVIKNLKIYDKNVVKHYAEYKKVIDCWKRIVQSQNITNNYEVNKIVPYERMLTKNAIKKAGVV